MTPRSLRRLKRVLLALPFLVLLLPPIQARLNIKILRSNLSGYEAKAPFPVFSWDKLRASTFQDSLELYLTEHIGLREQFVRPRNQLAYSLFGQSRAPQIIIGKDDVLFEDRAIEAYLGQDSAGVARVRSRVQQLKALQDTLARRGKLLVVTIAPSKATLLPQYLPSSVPRSSWGRTNYEQYAPRLRAAGVNFLDLVQLFRRWQDTTSFPLFPRGGTHWSGYGVTLAADTLFGYLEQRGGFDLPDFRAPSREITTTPRYTDNDLVRTLNTLWAPTAFRMAYPDVQFASPGPGQRQPNLLVVGDSFVWSFIEFYPYLQALFGPQSHFWYYNREVQWTSATQAELPDNEYQVAQLDRRAQLMNHDVVLVLFNEANLRDFDFGFTDDALQALAKP